jgi:hypothetical protein
MPDLSIATVVGYAFVDAIDPCSLAVLSLLLIAVITERPLAKNPNKKAVLYAGLAFTAAIFLTYFAFGLVLIQVFKMVEQASGVVYQMLFTALGVAAMVLGVYNIKDAVWPRHCHHEGIEGEIPSFLRPKFRDIASTVTTVDVAFLFGVLVTLLMMPFTMGPYVITGGILSTLEFMASIPWLALYNLVFIIPMLAVTLVVYMEYRTVEKISSWRNKAKYLHLITGFTMLGLGIFMLLGLF